MVQNLSFKIANQGIVEAVHDSLVNILHRPIERRYSSKSLVLVPRWASFSFPIRCAIPLIRSSNTLSLGSGKPNSVLGFSAKRVWLVTRFYIFILLR